MRSSDDVDKDDGRCWENVEDPNSLSFVKVIEDEGKKESEELNKKINKSKSCDYCTWDMKKACTTKVLSLLFRREGKKASLMWIAREIMNIKLSELEKIFRFAGSTICRAANDVEKSLRTNRPGKNSRNIEDNRSGS